MEEQTPTPNGEHCLFMPFRLPLMMVNGIVARYAKDNPQWDSEKPRRGTKPHPLIIKVLAALRHYATGDDYSSLEDAAQISESVLKVFIPISDLDFWVSARPHQFPVYTVRVHTWKSPRESIYLVFKTAV